MAHGKVTILGMNGHLGRHAAKTFASAGWEVTGFGRSAKRPIAGVRFIAGDAASVEDLRAAIGDSDVVVNALNLPYHQWDKGRMEALHGRVIEAMGTSGKTMLFPGNIYNYAMTERVLTPELEQKPATPRGAIRVRTERMLEAAARQGDLKVIIVRAGDFFGPGSTGDWFDQVILREASKQRVAMLGARGVGHAWAYLPDLARAFEILARGREAFGGFETFHFRGHYATPEEMADAIIAGAPVPLKASRFPWLLITLMGLANPIMREVSKMGYLWQHPMELRDDRLEAILGPDFGTPFEAAVAMTIAPFFERNVRAA